MALHISCEQARRLLALYHFTPTDLPGVFARLGTVQYDPLNPVGRNHDLVLQARVPGYHIDDWQKIALCWLLKTSVHKIGDVRQHNLSRLPSCLHEERLLPRRSRTGKFLLNKHSCISLGNQAEG